MPRLPTKRRHRWNQHHAGLPRLKRTATSEGHIDGHGVPQPGPKPSCSVSGWPATIIGVGFLPLKPQVHCP